MKYYTSTTLNHTTEYHITEGTAYIGFSTVGGSGFRVDQVNEGESWIEGTGEEVYIVAESEQAAYAEIDRIYSQNRSK